MRKYLYFLIKVNFKHLKVILILDWLQKTILRWNKWGKNEKINRRSFKE